MTVPSLVLALASLPLAALLHRSAGTESLPADAQPPDVTTYAGIDAALEGRVLLGPRATWRWFPGTGNPSPKWEWAKEDFDDAGWSTGVGPFGRGPSYDDLGTRVEPGVWTLYLRRTLELPDRRLYARVLLELPVDDGYVLFVNGTEEDRQHADRADTYHAFDATTTAERTLAQRPTPTVDMTKALRDGTNTLALQLMTHETDRETMAIRPVLRVVFARTPEGERERLEVLRGLLDRLHGGGGADTSYLEGRHLQRLGRHAEALPLLVRAAEADPAAPEPWARLVEAHRALGSLAALDAALAERVRAGEATAAMLDAWAGFAQDDLGVSCVAFAARFPDLRAGEEGVPAAGPFAEALWAGRRLAEGAPLRIDCGAVQGPVGASTAADDGAWSGDRCFAPGTAARTLAADAPLGTHRVCARSLDVLRAAYRVPVAPGPYEVVVRPSAVAEAGAFELWLEGAPVARHAAVADGAAAAEIRLPVFVHDGFVDVDPIPTGSADPWLAALEVLPLDVDDALVGRFDAAWGARTAGDAPGAFALVQLAEAAWATGDLEAAVASYERAEALPAFRPRDRQRLAALRDARLPVVDSLAAADDLARRRAGEAMALLEAVRAAGGDEDVAGYLEGRILQLAGRLDEALGAYEPLVFAEDARPLPVQRFVECLTASKLSEEALAILGEAWERGVPRTDAMLQLWISLQLGPLGTDRWEVVRALSELEDVPDELVVVPTSEEAPRWWKVTELEPPATAWSQPDFDDGTWGEGFGMIGSGHTPGGAPRTHSNVEMVFGRQPFTLLENALLYPHYDVFANDAGECYLNGTLDARVSVATDAYVQMPVRQGSFRIGRNLLGEMGYNTRDASVIDVGILQPLATLRWIQERLDAEGAIRLNCGGADWTAPDGTRWFADRFYAWALARERIDEPAEIGGTELDPLYRTHRWFYDDSTGAYYQIPLPNGAYRVTLHFAEVEPKYAEPGARTFDVRLEKELVLDQLDVAAEAGFGNALVRTFDAQIADDWLDLLINDKDERSFLSALEVERLSGD